MFDSYMRKASEMWFTPTPRRDQQANAAGTIPAQIVKMMVAGWKIPWLPN
jgi:hypothetical protein